MGHTGGAKGKRAGTKELPPLQLARLVDLARPRQDAAIEEALKVHLTDYLEKKAFWQAFHEATDSLDHSSRWLRAVAIAENTFTMRLNSIIKKFLEPYEKSEKEGGEL